MKIKLLLFCILISQIVFCNSFPTEIIKKEVKYYHKAYNIARKKIKRVENKSKRLENKHPELLGGLKVSFCPECYVKKKRTKNENEFINNLSKSDKTKFNETVKSQLKKTYTNLSNEIIDLLF